MALFKIEIWNQIFVIICMKSFVLVWNRVSVNKTRQICGLDEKRNVLTTEGGQQLTNKTGNICHSKQAKRKKIFNGCKYLQ